MQHACPEIPSPAYENRVDSSYHLVFLPIGSWESLWRKGALLSGYMFLRFGPLAMSRSLPGWDKDLSSVFPGCFFHVVLSTWARSGSYFYSYAQCLAWYLSHKWVPMDVILSTAWRNTHQSCLYWKNIQANLLDQRLNCLDGMAWFHPKVWPHG